MSAGLYEASRKDLLREITLRQHRVDDSLSRLKNQDSGYADEHRKLSDLWGQVVWLLENAE